MEREDDTYSWELMAEYPGEGYTSYTINLTSQTWMTGLNASSFLTPQFVSLRECSMIISLVIHLTSQPSAGMIQTVTIYVLNLLPSFSKVMNHRSILTARGKYPPSIGIGPADYNFPSKMHMSSSHKAAPNHQCDSHYSLRVLSSEAETNQPQWWHYLLVVIPDVVTYPDAAFLTITNGNMADRSGF